MGSFGFGCAINAETKMTKTESRTANSTYPKVAVQCLNQALYNAMTRIAEYIEGYSLAEFKKDYKTVDVVIRNVEIIGEALKKFPQK